LLLNFATLYSSHLLLCILFSQFETLQTADEAVLKSASTITTSARYINSPRSFFTIYLENTKLSFIIVAFNCCIFVH